jgi:hypothetical protein
MNECCLHKLKSSPVFLVSASETNKIAAQNQSAFECGGFKISRAGFFSCSFILRKKIFSVKLLMTLRFIGVGVWAALAAEKRKTGFSARPAERK